MQHITVTTNYLPYVYKEVSWIHSIISSCSHHKIIKLILLNCWWYYALMVTSVTCLYHKTIMSGHNVLHSANITDWLLFKKRKSFSNLFYWYTSITQLLPTKINSCKSLLLLIQSQKWIFDGPLGKFLFEHFWQTLNAYRWSEQWPNLEKSRIFLFTIEHLLATI